MVSAYDFYPTLLDYLGLPVPAAECNLPGKSFAPLLRGEETEGHECVVIYDEYGPVRMIRTQAYKYVYRHAYGPHELYDLVNDPDERVNLAGEEGQQPRIVELKQTMDEWFARYVDPVRDGLRQDGTMHGQVELAR
jgi:arylsulfatase A-like enzyme